MIKGYCSSNIDGFAWSEWPELFADNITIGHRVRSLDGKHRLRVVGITHYVLEQMDTNPPMFDSPPNTVTARIIVELHTLA